MFSFDEEKDAEEILEEGFPDGVIDSGRMYLVAKYFHFIFGYGKIRLERQLIEWCKSQNPNFNPVTEADYLKKWISSAMKYDIKKVDKIIISKEEIETITLIESKTERKILFLILLIAKGLARKNNSTSDNLFIKYTNLGQVANLFPGGYITTNIVIETIHKNLDLFIIYPPQRELIGVKYGKPNLEEGEVAISNFSKEEINKLFEKLFSTNIIACEICGEEIEAKSNRKKYCDTCAKNADREFAKKRMRKKRNEEKNL